MRGSRRQARHAPAHARRSGEEGRFGAGAEVWADAGTGIAVDEQPAPLGADERGRVGAQPQAQVHAQPQPQVHAQPQPPDHAQVLGNLEAPSGDGADGPDEGQLRSGRAVLRGLTKRQRSLVVGGARLRLLVLASTEEDTIAVDLASGALVRLRVPWPEGSRPDLSPFDVVEATLADDPERDDLAQPEAATAASLPRHVGSLRGRRTRRLLARLAVAPRGPLLGFLGPSAPYWEFRGFRPSVALIRPVRGPQLIRRPGDGSTWVRFGLERDDVWLPVEDPHTCRALDASRRERLHGKALATALGFVPHYLVVAVSSPREGHCYKVCAAILPKD